MKLIFIKVTRDDKSFAQRICTLCITYLKHAITFRKQVMTNSQWLRQSAHSGSNYPGCMIQPFNMKILAQDQEDPMNDCCAWNDMNLAPESDTFDNLKLELEQAFGGECDESDEDEDEDPDLFNYKEKSFKEDDISNFDSNIIITVPDEMRERKCDACRQRFMLKESFEQHLKECIELKFNKFVTEGHQLLTMRKSRTLSANEFVRRMIFALKKMVKSLASCYKEVSDGPSTISDDKLSKKSNLFDSTIDADQSKNSMNNGIQQSASTEDIDPNSKHLLNLLEGRPNICIQKNVLEINRHNAITNIDYTAFQSNIVLDNKKETVNYSKAFNEHDNTYNVRQLNQIMPPKTSIGSPLPIRIKQERQPPEATVTIAQCSQCCESFTSLQQFEEHIRDLHNSRSVSSQSPISGVSRFFCPFFRLNYYYYFD